MYAYSLQSRENRHEKSAYSGWVLDPLSFDICLRRVGNSVVIRVPPELKKRLRLTTGQKARLYAASRVDYPLAISGFFVEFGRLKVIEKVRGLKFSVDTIQHAKFLVERLAKRFAATGISVSENGRDVECYIELGSISEGGYIRRRPIIVESLKEILKREAIKIGAAIKVLGEFEDLVEWPSVSLSYLPPNESEEVEVEWEMD